MRRGRRGRDEGYGQRITFLGGVIAGVVRGQFGQAGVGQCLEGSFGSFEHLSTHVKTYAVFVLLHRHDDCGELVDS